MKYKELERLSINGKLNYLVDYYDNAYSTIANYILGFNSEEDKLTIKLIAKNCYVSNATVERFVKVMGYQKFNDFKYHLKYEYENYYSSKRIYSTANYFNDLHASLNKTLCLIEEVQLKRLADAIVNVDRILLIAIGSSNLIALDLCYKLERMGLFAKAVCDSNLIHFSRSISSEHDLCIGITYSGKTKIVNETIEMCQQNGSQTCVITSVANKHIYSHVDYQLFVEAEDKLMRTNSSSARIAMLALIDALHTEILKSSKSEQFLANIKKTKLREY